MKKRVRDRIYEHRRGGWYLEGRLVRTVETVTLGD